MTSLLIIGLVVLAIAVPTCALFAFGVYLGATEEKAPPPPVAARNGQPDDSGIVTLVAHGASRSIAVDDEAVQWTDIATGAVFKVGKQGGALTKLSERPNSLRRLVNVDGDNVYWFEYARKYRAVMKIPKAGGEATELTGAFDVGCMAIDPGGEKDGRLYWIWATVGGEDRRAELGPAGQAQPLHHLPIAPQGWRVHAHRQRRVRFPRARRYPRLLR